MQQLSHARTLLLNASPTSYNDAKDENGTPACTQPIGIEEAKCDIESQYPSQHSIKPYRANAITIIFHEILQLYHLLSDDEKLCIEMEITHHVCGLKKANKTIAFEIQNELFVISKTINETGKLVEVIRRTAFIAAGGLGNVFCAKSLNSNEESDVLKLALDNYGSEELNHTCFTQLKNEIDFLSKINPEGKIELIQPKPRLNFEYTPIG
jgi:hypothetical protein